MPGFAQNSDSARIIDAFGAVDCDDAMARLDRFAEFVNKDPESLAYVVVYPERGGLPGKYKTYIDFSRSHLEMVRGISSNRIVSVRGQYRPELTTEFWVVPRSEKPPVTASVEEDPRFGKFDEGFADYSTSSGKQQLWTYDLCGLKALYFHAFAGQLRADPKSIGRLIIHLESGKPPGRAHIMAHLLRKEMVTEQGISSDRIRIVYGKPRKMPMVELWVQPQ